MAASAAFTQVNANVTEPFRRSAGRTGRDDRFTFTWVNGLEMLYGDDAGA